MNASILAAWQQLIIWLTTNSVAVLLTLGIIFVFIVLPRRLLPLLEEKARKNEAKQQAVASLVRGIRITAWLVSLIALMTVWGADIAGILLISTSLVTLTGVALFANWSIISNITAYWILIFNLNYQPGIRIRIIDGDNFIEGVVEEVGLFQITIRMRDGGKVLYPNNLVLTRPAIINSADIPAGVGKTASQKPAN